MLGDLFELVKYPSRVLLKGVPALEKQALSPHLVALLAITSAALISRTKPDLTDLFGSDLPVEGGRAGEFAWKDAAFYVPCGW